MILVAIGSNMPGPFGEALDMVRAVPELLAARNVLPVAGSRIYATQPIGAARQNCYYNAVVNVQSVRSPQALLMVLKQIETRAGRTAGTRWGPRSLDLDLIAYHDLVTAHWSPPAIGNHAVPPLRHHFLILPHPYAHVRPFVIKPLSDIAKNWRHPVLGMTAHELWRRQRLSRQGAIIAECAGFDPVVFRRG